MKKTVLGIAVYLLVNSWAFTNQAFSYEDPAIHRFFTLYRIGYQGFKPNETSENEFYTQWRGGDLIRF